MWLPHRNLNHGLQARHPGSTTLAPAERIGPDTKSDYWSNFRRRRRISRTSCLTFYQQGCVSSSYTTSFDNISGTVMSRLSRGKEQLRRALVTAFGRPPSEGHPSSKKIGARRLEITREQAKEYLSAVRPDGVDAGDPALQQALELAQKDSELGSWLARQQEFDEILIEKFSSIRPPEGLREIILESLEETARPIQSWRMGWLALAATG